MSQKRKLFSRAFSSLVIPIGLGLIGFAINYLPVEIFPGVHLIFGSTLSILAALKFGPVAGGVAGLTAGLRTWSLWNQPLPFSACLYGLEGVWVGYTTRNGKRGPLTAALSYWILLGAWLNLAGQLFLHGLPLRVALIIQARSVINGLLAGMFVEIALLIYEIFHRRHLRIKDEPARLSLSALATLVLAATITLPMLYISTHNVNDVHEDMVKDLIATSSRDVKVVEGEIRTTLRNYERGVKLAADIISSPVHRHREGAELSKLLAGVREKYPEFAGMYVADQSGRAIAFDPMYSETGRNLIGTDYSYHRYYRDLLDTKETVYSGVYQAQGPMSGPTVAIGEPLFDERHQFVGFVLGLFDLSSFQKMVSLYEHEGEALIITDEEGGLIADSSLQPGEYREAVSLASRRDFELVKDKLSDTAFYTETIGEPDHVQLFALNHTSLVSSTTVPITGWKVLSRQSLRPVAARLEEFYIDNLYVLMFALFLTLAISRGLAQWLTRPMVELQQSAAALAAGNLSERPPHRRLITTEFDSLFRSFRRMAEGLEASWNRQQELLREVSIAKGELEATFDAMTDGVLITDSEDCLLRANRAYYRLRGIKPERAVGRIVTDIAHPGQDWRDCEVCCARREGRHAVVLRKSEENLIGRDLEIRVDPIYNAAGERVGAVQVLRDLTEKRQAEAEAEKASALLRNLVDAAYDAVYAAGLDGRFLWANKRAAELLGLESDSVEGESFLLSIHLGDLERVRSIFDKAAAGEAQSYEARYLATDGGVRHVLVTNSPVYAGSDVVAVLGIMRDVTEERLATEQAMRSDKLRALGQLASGVAHNFNNSLTAVLGYTQMALSKITDTKVTRHLKTVETAALDAAKMVQRIQNFARQQKDDPLSLGDLNQIIRDALDLTRSRWRDDARASGIEYDIIFRPAEDTLVMSDQSALREVFVNIIINALDAMSTGGRLTITTAVEDGFVLASISDTGYGITEEVRRRIFEPFYTTKGARGYGMGLAVTYGIIERHGGEIQVESEPGHGATFTIKLPVGLDATEEDVKEESPSARKASVLVVDDEAPIRTLLSDVLRARGHNVLVAEDGLAGLRAVEGARFDLVITDLSMPGIDGWSLVNEVRRRWPSTKLMVVTGYGGFADLAVPGLDVALIDAFISKPFNLTEIDSKVNELLLNEF